MVHRLRSTALLIAAVAALVSTLSTHVSTQSGTPQYGVTLLGDLGAQPTVPQAIDYGGFANVYGWGTTATGNRHAFLADYYQHGTLTDLGTLGGANSEVRASSYYFGVVAGRAQVASGAYHAFSMNTYGSPRPPMRDLGTLGGSTSEAMALANVPTTPGTSRLVIVGSSTLASGTKRAFTYDASTNTMADLGATLGGAQTAAFGINGSGHVVGWAETGAVTPDGTIFHAFLYANGTTTDLAVPGQTSWANAINDSDVIVGASEMSFHGVHRAFRWQNGLSQDLGDLGGGSAEALAISPQGTIVGWAQTSDGSNHAFVWRDGVMTDLNTLIPPGSGWVLQSATAIGSGNNLVREAIVGYGLYQGQTRAFMLVPALHLYASLRQHENNEDTNFPNPFEAGSAMSMGVTIFNDNPWDATNVVVRNTFTGPVEIGNPYSPDNPACTKDGLTVTCTFARVYGAGFGRDLLFSVKTTGPGAITHTAQIVSADQPDPSPGGSLSESNTAVSLASLVAATSSVQGGGSVLTRATLTSTTPTGGATVKLTSSNPDVATVPSQFDVLPGCCDNGTWREFYISTKPVSAPVTVQISGTYGLVTKTMSLTVTPGPSSSPYGGSPRAIPGTIQAEDFDDGGEGVAYHDTGAGNNGGAYRSTDVDIESSADAGGGYDVGWMAASEWLNYGVNVSQTGTYLLTARVAASGAGGSFHVEFGGANKTGTLTIPDTGGWQAWTDISTLVQLTAGAQTMRFVADASGAAGIFGNLNYVKLTLQSTGGGSTPYGGAARPIPGTVQAEDFDDGGEGVAYHDTGAGNNGGEYRLTDVDIETSNDAGGGGYDVGWMAAGEWMNYTVNVAQAGTYTFTARVAASGAGGNFHVEFGGVNKTGTLTIPNTGGWQAWTDVSATVTLPAGMQTMRFVADANGPSGIFGNLQYVKLVAQSTGGGSTPYGGSARAIPGTVQAEDFDNGGEGVAYHDTGAGNNGGGYRATDVDIEPTSDTGGGYDVGWMAGGEWLNYTVNVTTAGTYTLTARVAASGAGGTFHVEFGGVNKTGALTIPNTGGWQAWTDVSVTVSLAAGAQTMRFVADANGPSGIFGNLNYMRLTATSAPPPPPPSGNIVLYSTDFTLHGNYATAADATAAGGAKVQTPDNGSAATSAPLAGPTDYFEATFSAPAGTVYAVWLRLKATANSKYNDSVWVQFSDALANGSTIYPIGTASGLLVNLEPCNACGVSGWGWQNGAYWLSQPAAVSFAAAGTHTIRVQVREDGAQIDQIVLSPSQYFSAAPGAQKDDSTVVPR